MLVDCRGPLRVKGFGLGVASEEILRCAKNKRGFATRVGYGV